MQECQGGHRVRTRNEHEIGGGQQFVGTIERPGDEHAELLVEIADLPEQPFPLRSGTVSLILNVFAPRNGPEFHRVLRPGGTLIVATPADGHLAELVGPAGLLSVDEHKDSRLAATLGPYFTVTARRDLTVPLRLTPAEAVTLIGMGPSARHTDPTATRNRLATLPEPIPVTAAFTVTRYQPR